MRQDSRQQEHGEVQGRQQQDRQPAPGKVGWNRDGQLGYGTPENVGEKRAPAAVGDVPL